MSRVVDGLPDRPLTQRELDYLASHPEILYPYVYDPELYPNDSYDCFILATASGGIFGLWFDPDLSEWTVPVSGDLCDDSDIRRVGEWFAKVEAAKLSDILADFEGAVA